MTEVTVRQKGSVSDSRGSFKPTTRVPSPSSEATSAAARDRSGSSAGSCSQPSGSTGGVVALPPSSERSSSLIASTREFSQ